MGRKFGRFELLERIGVGGMAEVWKARVAGVGGFEKMLVVKKILPAFAQNKTFVDMLLAEARLCAILQHTNIVQTYENGEIDSQYYIAMEWVQGFDLFKILSRATQVTRRLPPELALLVSAEVAKGLGYAHNAKDHRGRPLQIIHRDVSPSNIIISEAGEVKVTDFGVARAAIEGRNRDAGSKAGVLKGKLGYMSPEQVTGQAFDHRSDIFSLGIILYESITLKRLFLGRTDLETLVNIRDARIEHKFRKHSYIDEGVRSILRRSLAKDPDERYASALDMHDDIVNLLFESKIQVSNRSLAAFLADLFDAERDRDVVGKPAAQSPTTRERIAPPLSARTAAETSQHSLSFSAEAVEEKIKARIRAKREAMRAASVAEPPSDEGPASQEFVSVQDVDADADADADTDTASVIEPRTSWAEAEPAQAEDVALPTSRRPSSRAVSEGFVDGAPLVATPGPADGEAMPLAVLAVDVEGDSGARQASPHRLKETQRVVRPAGPASSHRYHLRTGDGHVLGPLSLGNIEGMVRSRAAGGSDLISVEEGPFKAVREVSHLAYLMDELDRTREPPVAQGTLTRLIFPKLVFDIFANRATGCLELKRDHSVKSLYFRRGRPQHIASNQKGEMLGAFMVSNGFISQADVDLALQRVEAAGGRLGDVLIGLNLIKPFQLYQVLERQFRSKFIDAYGWDNGEYAFYAGEAPPADIVPLDLDPISALAEGVREKLPLSILEPQFSDYMDKAYFRTRNPRISVESLRFQAREAKALGMLMASKTLREAVDEKCRNRQQRLALLHVLFIMLQTELLTFDPNQA